MGATYSRVKNWTAEILTASDLNAEIDNILTNHIPSGMDDYSTNATEMQTNTDPGEVGSESLATSTAGELERLRFAIKEIKGTTQWYETAASDIGSIFALLGSTQLSSRITSGAVRTGSSQSAFLQADGGGVTATALGATTNLVYIIADTQYTISTDTQITGLSTAPSSNNTALVNDLGIADGEETKYLGEFGSSLIVDNMGTEIVGNVGKYIAFKITAASDEYFHAFVKSTTELTHITRGAFFNTSLAPVPRIVVANNDTITLLQPSWIFAKTDLTLTKTTTPPRVSDTEPTSPASGDYWFDLSTELWMKHDGVSYVDSTATLIGVVLCDDTNSLCSLSSDINKDVKDVNTVSLEVFSTTEVRAKETGSQVHVFGSDLKYLVDVPRWDIATDLDTGITEAASTEYYCYLTEVSKPVISDLCPRDLRDTRLGLYHPHQTWRCVGSFYNDASSDIEFALSYSDESESNYVVSTAVASSALTVKTHKPPHIPFNLGADTTRTPVAMLPGTSFVVSSGSTLYTSNATEAELILHIIGQNGRTELGLGFNRYSEKHTTTAEGGAGAADSTLLYSTTARTDAYITAVAKLLSTQTTAGTWDTAISQVYTDHKFLSTVNIKEFTTSGTLITPDAPILLEIEMIGGGGGGGGAYSFNHGGGGAGAGYVVESDRIPSSETITVTLAGAAAGGVGGASSTAGTAGGTTTVASTTLGTLSAKGGGGGGTAGAAGGVPTAGGAAGGIELVAGTDSVRFAGGTSGGANGGGGGASHRAIGGLGPSGNTNGTAAGANSGAGGGGGGGNNAGGAGGSGFVRLTWTA